MVAEGAFWTPAALLPGKHVRWSNENPDRRYRLQPFGGYLADFREFGGYRLPASVEGGNHFGTDAYFPFYKATVTEVRLHGVD